MTGKGLGRVALALVVAVMLGGCASKTIKPDVLVAVGESLTGRNVQVGIVGVTFSETAELPGAIEWFDADGAPAGYGEVLWTTSFPRERAADDRARRLGKGDAVWGRWKGRQATVIRVLVRADRDTGQADLTLLKDAWKPSMTTGRVPKQVNVIIDDAPGEGLAIRFDPMPGG